MKKITDRIIEKFKKYLINEEKSDSTIDKYIRDVRAFAKWLDGNITKEDVLLYKKEIISKYAPASCNAIISSLNSFFVFSNCGYLKIKAIKIQRQIYIKKENELTKLEYERLLTFADERLYLIMQTICSSGIRVSELKFITGESVRNRKAIIDCKGKIREVFLPKKLCKMLSAYIKKKKLIKGSIFITKKGKPLDRSNIWRMLKNLCEKANVDKNKVFPHNLRHLFARTFYKMHKDIVRLADILGHSSINTTRIYTMETSEIGMSLIEKLCI